MQKYVLPIRIYYEDTDAGGIVYHASYLRFMERARTDFLREYGHERRMLAEQFGVQFVVSELSIKYLKPALLDDLVEATAAIESLSYAGAIFQQTVERNGEILAKATAKAVCITCDGLKPAAIPQSLREKLKGLL